MLDRLSGVTWMPTAFRSLWTTFTAATQSEKPPLLMMVNESGLPFFSKMPLLPRVNPAASRIEMALAGL